MARAWPTARAPQETGATRPVTSSAAETELNEQINELRAQPCAPKAAQVRQQNVTAAEAPVAKAALAPAPHLTAPRSARCDMRG